MVNINSQTIARSGRESGDKTLRQSAENASAFVCIWKGKDYVYEFVSPQYQKLYGSRQLIGKTFLEIHPQLKGSKIKRLLDKVFKTGTPYTGAELPFPVHGEKAENMYFNFSYQPIITHSNEISGIVAFGYDVTSQLLLKKEVEYFLTTVLKSLPAMTWTSLPNGEINFYNQKWVDYTGLNYEELEGDGLVNIIHGDDYKRVANTYKISLLTGKVFEVEVRFKKKYDGEYRWHLCRALPIYNKNNEIELWVGTATDLHEQKMKEQKKDEFIGIASHEMKTPLTTAKAYLQLLELALEESNDPSLLYARKASTSINRLNDLIVELLDVSKIQHGKLEYNLAAFDFDEMLDATIESMQFEYPGRTIMKKGGRCGEVVGDKDRLQQVLINLLSNALKYSPHQEPVLINAERQETVLQVTIEDFGIGISKSDQDKIFERYYRVETQSVKFQGLGIGLFITKEIIERHKGRLWVESEQRKGTAFSFLLPVTIR